MGTTQKFTNSPLVDYTQLSPCHSGQRVHDIDRITPHCFVGQVTVERIGKAFAPKTKNASCNYGIGLDGRVALIVEEKNRSWCSSSNANDQRAITIECASDSTSPYAFKDAVYNKLILLCVDICKRYNKTKLIWIADKATALAYNPQADEMLLTVHRWYAQKSCPGPWLMDRMGDLAKQVTIQLTGSIPTPDPEPTPSQDNAETIWNYFMAKINNPYGVAGLMGNLYAESALNPHNLQNSYEKTLGIDDDEYTEIVDNGSYTNFVKDKAGYGLAQWTYWSRKQNLLNYAKKVGKSIGDLGMQLDFLWNELQGYKVVINTLNNAKSVKEASDIVLTKFEKPSNQGESVKNARAAYGQVYYDKFAAPTPIFIPYKVKVTAKVLNYRSGPGTNYKINGTIRDQGIYTIVEESTGKGATKWGKLKSRNGWVSLDYCQKL